MEVSDSVKAKISEAIEIWAEDNLEGKPAILANAVYFSTINFLESKTKEVEEEFKD